MVPGGNGASDADERCRVSEVTGEPVAEAVVIDLSESLIEDSAGPTETSAERDTRQARTSGRAATLAPPRSRPEN